MKNKAANPEFIAVDFFSGAGGTTRGLIDAGGYVIAGIDKDTSCRDTYTKNNKNNSIDEENARFINYDIFPKDDDYPQGEQHLLFEELDHLISNYKSKTKPNTPLFFAICAPCQPFTNISKNEMTENRQNKRQKDRSLLKEACKFVDRFKPDIVLSENVAGITQAKFGHVWQWFRDELDRLGYVTGSKVVCASKFGIPQYRKRSILLAVRKEKANTSIGEFFTDGEIVVPLADKNVSLMSVEEAIGHLPPLKAGETHETIPNHRTRNLSELNLRRLSVAKPGETNAYLENTIYGDLSLPCHKRAKEKHKQRCFSDVYTRLNPKRPSPTITTKCQSISNGRFGHYDTDQVRGISLREAALLQSFDDNYVFYDNSLGAVARMVGNAVPPRLAKFFAKYLTDIVKSY